MSRALCADGQQTVLEVRKLRRTWTVVALLAGLRRGLASCSELDSMDILHFLGYCSLVNYSILTIWFLALVLARDRIYGLHRIWFRLSEEQLDQLHYGAMAIYKILVLVLNFVPYLVLRFFH